MTIPTTSLKTSQMLREEWITIKSYESYQISTHGRVKRLYKNGTNKILRNILSKGYLQVTLSTKCFKETVRIHRLVAHHFINNFNQYTCINHKDGVKQNNYIENLEWCTYSQNAIHAHRVLKVGNDSKGENNPSSRLRSSQILEMRYLYDHNLMSINYIACKYGISYQHTHDIVKRKKWKHI